MYRYQPDLWADSVGADLEREQAQAEKERKKRQTNMATYFRDQFKERCGPHFMMANEAALGRAFRAARGTGKTNVEIKAAIDRFCGQVATGSIKVGGKPPWRVFLAHFPSMMEESGRLGLATDTEEDKAARAERRLRAMAQLRAAR